jgi:hypothetical protein
MRSRQHGPHRDHDTACGQSVRPSLHQHTGRHSPGLFREEDRLVRRATKRHVIDHSADPSGGAALSRRPTVCREHPTNSANACSDHPSARSRTSSLMPTEPSCEPATSSSRSTVPETQVHVAVHIEGVARVSTVWIYAVNATSSIGIDVQGGPPR